MSISEADCGIVLGTWGAYTSSDVEAAGRGLAVTHAVRAHKRKSMETSFMFVVVEHFDWLEERCCQSFSTRVLTRIDKRLQVLWMGRLFGD